jgi:hypothetical protein
MCSLRSLVAIPNAVFRLIRKGKKSIPWMMDSPSGRGVVAVPNPFEGFRERLVSGGTVNVPRV